VLLRGRGGQDAQCLFGGRAGFCGVDDEPLVRIGAVGEPVPVVGTRTAQVLQRQAGSGVEQAADHLPGAPWYTKLMSTPRRARGSMVLVDEGGCPVSNVKFGEGGFS
jgi:hypothetical protein